MTKEDIAIVLKQARLNAGYTQKEAAEKLGKKQQTIASWETGQSQPDANTLFFICSIYGTTVDEAFGFTKNKQRFSPEDIQLVQKYHDLDPHGREMVDFVLDKEHARVTAKVVPLSRPSTIAAHFDGDEFTEDELDEIREFTESVKNKEK